MLRSIYSSRTPGSISDGSAIILPLKHFQAVMILDCSGTLLVNPGGLATNYVSECEAHKLSPTPITCLR